jgi:hypothetical protein
MQRHDHGELGAAASQRAGLRANLIRTRQSAAWLADRAEAVRSPQRGPVDEAEVTMAPELVAEVTLEVEATLDDAEVLTDELGDAEVAAASTVDVKVPGGPPPIPVRPKRPVEPLHESTLSSVHVPLSHVASTDTHVDGTP